MGAHDIMGETPISITFQGKDQDGVLVDVVNEQGPLHELCLSDGSVLKVKLVTTGVVRLDHLKDSFGFPTYVLQSGVVISAVKGPDSGRIKAH